MQCKIFVAHNGITNQNLKFSFKQMVRIKSIFLKITPKITLSLIIYKYYMQKLKILCASNQSHSLSILQHCKSCLAIALKLLSQNHRFISFHQPPKHTKFNDICIILQAFLLHTIFVFDEHKIPNNSVVSHILEN